MTVLYGIPNCDTVKKARVWLQEHGVEYEFSDFKKQPPTEGDIRAWLADVPSDTLLNRRGTTWRKLSEAERAAVQAAAGERAETLGLIRLYQDADVIVMGFQEDE